MIKVFDRDKAGAIAYLDEKKIESITFEKESFFEPNVEVVYWNKLEDKFFLFLKKEAMVVKMDSGSKFYFILEKGKEKEFTENILVSKKIETDCNIFLGKNEVLKNGMLILKEYDCNIFNETDVIEITTDNLNKFSNYFTKNIAEAILSLQTMKPEERTVKKLEWLSCFLRKDKGIEEQKVNEIVSILKFSI